MTMAFPDFREISVLYITVEVGLVDGINAATTPTGTPISQIPCPSSSRSIPTTFRSLIDWWVTVLPNRFFNILSCQLPKPVSSQAIFAKRSAFWAQASAIAATMASSWS